MYDYCETGRVVVDRWYNEVRHASKDGAYNNSILMRTMSTDGADKTTLNESPFRVCR